MTTGGEGNQGFCKVEFSDVSKDNFTSARRILHALAVSASLATQAGDLLVSITSLCTDQVRRESKFYNDKTLSVSERLSEHSNRTESSHEDTLLPTGCWRGERAEVHYHGHRRGGELHFFWRS